MSQTGDLYEGFSGLVGNNIEWIGNLIGALVAEGKRAEAQKVYETALADIADEQLPQFKEIVAQQIQQQASIKSDPAVREAQLRAMRQMQDVADQGGMDAGSRLAVQEARQAADAQASGQRQAALASAARRGGVDTGSMLAADLAGGQAASNRSNSQSMQASADARSRALNAIAQSGSMAGNIRTGDFNEDSTNMKAAQERELFNAKMRQSAALANNQIAQDEYDSRMKRLVMMNAARGDVAAGITGEAKEQEAKHRRMSSMWNAKGKAAGQTIGSAVDAYGGGM